jgi:hypothetical protein
MQPTFRDAFAVIGGTQVEFRPDAGAKVTGFAVHAGRIRNVMFSR